jgi:glycosyltransferase involved in cell wall biosynthesis
MSLGLPIIATQVGGVGDALQDGLTARLVPAADAAALARAVIGFLNAPAAARELGRGARRAFEERHDAAVMVRAYLDLYERKFPGKGSHGMGSHGDQRA